MSDATVIVRPVDFADDEDTHRFIEMLDAYARDPMGADRALPGAVKDRLRIDLPRLPNAHGLLAEAADVPIGFATCFIGYSTFQARPLLNVHDIAVLDAWRGRSVAGQLLAAIADLGRRLGCCRLTLEVREDNQAARRAYARAGFVAAPCDLFLECPLD